MILSLDMDFKEILLGGYRSVKYIHDKYIHVPSGAKGKGLWVLKFLSLALL